MSLPYPIDPSLPSNPSPLFSDSEAVRGDHLRANNGQIWANFDDIVSTILGGASLSIDGTMAANSDLKFPSEKAIRTYINARLDALVPIGTSFEYSGMQANIPASFMIESGANLLRDDYAACFSALSAVIGTVTISIATPGVVTYVGHPLQTGDCVHLTTSGALPTGLSANTNYYVIVINGNTFNLATTYANALAGTKINTSGSQSGTHTLTWIPWGAADGTHFYLPDTQGLTTEGSGQLTTNGAAWGSSEYAGRIGQYKQDQMQRITGNITEVMTVSSFSTSSGAITKTETVSSNFLGSSSSVGRITLGFDSDNSPDARTSATTAGKTAGPRVGKWKIIKVM